MTAPYKPRRESAVFARACVLGLAMAMQEQHAFVSVRVEEPQRT